MLWSRYGAVVRALAPESFRARKAIFKSSVSKNGEVYTLETSCMKGTSLHLQNMRLKQLCTRKVRDFAMALRARKLFGAFEKRAPAVICGLSLLLVLVLAPSVFFRVLRFSSLHKN